MRIRIKSWRVAGPLLLAVAAAACGGASASTTTTSAAETSASTTSAPSTTALPATTTTAAVTTTTAPPDPASLPLIEDEFGGAVSGDGWLVGAGTYTTNLLPNPVIVEMAEPMAVTVLAEDGPLLVLAAPDVSFSADPAIFIGPLAGFADPAVAGTHSHDPTPLPFGDTGEMTEYFDANFVLLESGTETLAGVEAPWWEFTVADEGVNGFPCQFGPECFNVAVHEEVGNFIAGADWTYRVWQIVDGDPRVFVWFQGTDEGYDDSLQWATEILDGVTLVDDVDIPTDPSALTEADLALADALGAAYNSHDFAAMSALFAGGSPEFSLAVAGQAGTWTADEIESELAFAAVVGDHWELERCKKEFGRVSCRYIVTDPLIERTGLEPPVVTIGFAEEDGYLVAPTANLITAFNPDYDREMHAFGDWFRDAYPDEVSVQGFHHRGWNIEDSGAAELFMEHLDEWIASRG